MHSICLKTLLNGLGILTGGTLLCTYDLGDDKSQNPTERARYSHNIWSLKTSQEKDMSQNPTERARYSHGGFMLKNKLVFCAGLKTLLNGLGILTTEAGKEESTEGQGLKTLLNGLGILTKGIKKNLGR